MWGNNFAILKQVYVQHAWWCNLIWLSISHSILICTFSHYEQMILVCVCIGSMEGLVKIPNTLNPSLGCCHCQASSASQLNYIHPGWAQSLVSLIPGTVHSVYCIQTVNKLNSEHQRSSGINGGHWTNSNLAKFVNTLYSRRAGGEDCCKGWAEHPGWATRQTSASLSSLLALLLASNHSVVRKHTIWQDILPPHRWDCRYLLFEF